MIVLNNYLGRIWKKKATKKERKKMMIDACRAERYCADFYLGSYRKTLRCMQ
jgi:hypothetical protein